jgi:beta-lactamase regulating signal transducer with metallopeptidase domain
MSVLLEIAIKTSALFVLALAALRLLRSRSAALRHGVLALTFVCAIAVPILTSFAPAWRLPIPIAWLAFDQSTPITISSDSRQSSRAAAAVATTGPVVPSRTRVSPLSIVAGVWLAGTLAALIQVIAGLWHLRHIARRAAPLQSGPWREILDRTAHGFGIQRSIALLQGTHPTMLVTWGVIRPRILLPASVSDWSTERIEVVLRHELAHITRSDWPLLIAASVLRAMHWFNPIVWMGHRRLRQESEQACDDLVLESGITPADYAAHLLAVARDTIRRRHVWSAATAIAHPSTLEGRVRAMLNARLNRRPMSALARCTSALFALTATVAIAGAGVSTLAAPVVALPPSPPAQANSQPAAADHLDIYNATLVAPDGSRVTAAHLRLELPSAAAAQQTGPGTISGVLYDQLGGLLPGAAVTLVQQPDGGRYDTTTDRSGSFSFKVLPPGDYQLTTSLPGFAKVTNLVKVASGQTIDRALTMPMGTLQETISVTGPAGPLEVGQSLNQVTQSAPRPARPRPAPEARTFYSGGIGGQIRVPTKTFHVSPVYPPSLQNAYGIVVLEARVGIDGLLSDIRDVTGSRSSPPHQAFLASAIDAVRQWEFTPTLLNNVPVEANITIRVDYSVR